MSRRPFAQLTLMMLSLVCAEAVLAQPRVVRDINVMQSPVNSSPIGLATIGNITFFNAFSPEFGNELWKTDGTTTGTQLVRDIRLGPDSALPSDRYYRAPVIGNRVLFLANDGEHGLEVWASDGTMEGTMMLADIAPGEASLNAAFGPVVGSTAYFVAAAPATGLELWRTDGTPAGTRIVKDLNPGIASSSPRTLGSTGSLLVFSTFNGATTGLFTTDGTEEGTKLIAPFSASSGTSLGSLVLFTVATGSNTWNLMKTDGTAGGTAVVRSTFNGALPGFFTVAGGVAYFVASDGAGSNQVWRSDGTESGTRLVADLAPGAARLSFISINRLAEKLLFVTGGASGQLWISDGTAAGTHVVKNVPYATGGFVSGNTFYFGWSDGIRGFKLWKSDGSSEGTAMVADIAAGSADSMYSAFFVERPGGGILFSANDLATGFELWISDGTPAGTRMLRNIAPDTALSSYPWGLASIGTKLFFIAYDGVTSHVWTSDGTAAGTVPLKYPSSGPGPVGAGVVSGGLYYFVVGSLPDFELWRTDGTDSGTFRLFSQSAFRMLDVLVPAKGGLFFQATDPEHGVEPWFSDGTVAGTKMIADLLQGPEGSFVYAKGAIAAGDRVYFAAEGTGQGGVQPWRTDGTAAGTRTLSVPNPGDSYRPRTFTRVGGLGLLHRRPQQRRIQFVAHEHHH